MYIKFYFDVNFDVKPIYRMVFVKNSHLFAIIVVRFLKSIRIFRGYLFLKQKNGLFILLNSPFKLVINYLNNRQHLTLLPPIRPPDFSLALMGKLVPIF